MARLEGKVAIITGASAGIGESTALLFAREGATVVLAARREEKMKEMAAKIVAEGGKALAVKTDVGKLEDCKNLVAKTIEAFGKIDILVNNAGIADMHKSCVATDDDFWNHVVLMNQTSLFWMCREVLPHMVDAKYGSIVNVSSIGGVYGSAGIAYSATKSAVLGMTKNIAIQYAGTGIRCNATAPGPTPTELNTPEKLATFDQEMREITGRHMDTSLPESDVIDQAYAILYYACDESRAVTGRCTVVDHGWTL
ncbi:SDR family NAD(P)-dependent oxidoreductase [uncultured Cohaesibacter sp.]|uniref:SDR family NAD(P)-dependent oxidoreductase n=1 Tax=uncultured Cohaesibacter sp. TaxID=1002546 RepID=UPI00292F54FB|nr:SDR family NAD(P)-dependent oxidoreductase [uncultured Cohaesibacter sp.]